jgi:hypothetical protein
VRAQGGDCTERSAYLDPIEAQLGDYLAEFHIPDDYQSKILTFYESVRRSLDDVESAKSRLETRLQRIRELYSWGDLSREQYLEEKDHIQRELKSLERRSRTQAAR